MTVTAQPASADDGPRGNGAPEATHRIICVSQPFRSRRKPGNQSNAIRRMSSTKSWNRAPETVVRSRLDSVGAGF
jgi:hypothetical protein